MDRPKPVRCRVGWHPWPGAWSKPKITPDIQDGVLLGHYWVSHRACPLCGAIQTKNILISRVQIPRGFP